MPLSKIVANSIADDTITTDQIADTSVHGRRNILINGAMEVNQRGTQTTSTTTNNYFVDRFNVYIQATAVASLSQSTDVPSGQGFSYSAKIDVTTANASPAAGDQAHFRQILEGQDLQQLCYGTSSAKKLTLSFWVKSSKTGTHIIEFYNAASAGAKQQSQSYTISAADTWEHKTITIDGDTSSIIDNTTVTELYVQWVLQAGSNYQSGTLNTSWNTPTTANRYVGQVNFFDNTSNNMYVTGAQHEVGDKATPFEHRSFGEELALCQRYTWKLGGFGSDQYFGAPWLYFDGNNIHNGPFFNPVQMRAQPSMIQYGTPIIKDNGTAISGFSFSLQSSGKEQCFSIQGVKGGHGLANDPLNCLNSPSTSDYFIMDAEL